MVKGSLPEGCLVRVPFRLFLFLELDEPVKDFNSSDNVTVTEELLERKQLRKCATPILKWVSSSPCKKAVKICLVDRIMTSLTAME